MKVPSGADTTLLPGAYRSTVILDLERMATSVSSTRMQPGLAGSVGPDSLAQFHLVADGHKKLSAAQSAGDGLVDAGRTADCGGGKGWGSDAEAGTDAKEADCAPGQCG